MMMTITCLVVLVSLLGCELHQVHGFSQNHQRSERRTPPKSSSTKLHLGFLDLGSNTVNTPVLQSSLVAEPLTSTSLSYANDPLKAYSNATAVISMDLVVKDEVNPPFPFISAHLGYRLLLAAVACVYGTNFPLGSILDQSLPPSAASSGRFFLAAMALSPFVFQLKKELIPMALFGGCFTAMGYIAQSLALADVSPATVSFLGAATVIWCPLLEFVVHKKSLSWKDRPQVWIAGVLCLAGVGLLELFGADGTAIDAAATVAPTSNGWMGDALALLQAVGFGTGIFMSEQMMKKEPEQALSITGTMVATTAFCSLLWALSDGWIGNAPGWESMMLPNILMGNTGDLMANVGDGVTGLLEDPFLLAKAVLWTGLVSTSLNFFLEIYALGQVPPGEASVILATEPLWAAAFASVILGETMGWNDYAGGFLIVAACLIGGAQPEAIHNFLSGGQRSDPLSKSS